MVFFLSWFYNMTQCEVQRQGKYPSQYSTLALLSDWAGGGGEDKLVNVCFLPHQVERAGA